MSSVRCSQAIIFLSVFGLSIVIKILSDSDKSTWASTSPGMMIFFATAITSVPRDSFYAFPDSGSSGAIEDFACGKIKVVF